MVALSLGKGGNWYDSSFNFWWYNNLINALSSIVTIHSLCRLYVYCITSNTQQFTLQDTAFGAWQKFVNQGNKVKTKGDVSIVS